MACLRSLLGSSWPADRLRVILVDNASSDDVVTRVRTELPAVEVLENDENVGFGAGCNRGIRALPDVDLVALVNNDATVDPEWLRPLVDALDADPGVGAACPKILFAGAVPRDRAPQPDHRAAGRGDDRDLGVLIAGARVDGVDVWRRVQLVDGTWGVEPGHVDGAAWTRAEARLHVPAPDTPSASTTVPAPLRRRARARWSSARVTPWWCTPSDASPPGTTCRAGGPTIRVVNNVGTELTARRVRRRPRLPRPRRRSLRRTRRRVRVVRWRRCCCARAYLDDVGLFDEGLFLYYEDLELAWRGAKRGWRYRYVPDSVVHHVHTASSVTGFGVQALLRRAQPPPGAGARTAHPATPHAPRHGRCS